MARHGPKTPETSRREFAILSDQALSLPGLQTHYQPVCRATRSDPVTAFIERRWKQRQTEPAMTASRLFNGRLFRLDRFQAGSDNLILELSDTDYRAYVGTRSSEFRAEFPDEEPANPLAVCAAIVCTDARIAVGRRIRVETNVGQYHVVGGFMDRNADLASGVEPDPFLALRREAREEVGLRRVDDARVLGLAYDLRMPHPELCLHVRTPVTSRELAKSLAPFPSPNGRGTKGEGFGEIAGLEFVDATEEGLSAFLNRHRDATTPTGAACLILYGKAAFGRAWFERMMASDR